MPQSQTIPVDGNDNVLMTYSPTGVAIPTFTVGNPATTGVYLAAVADVVGTVASNNYIVLFNPISNTKTVSFIGNLVDLYAFSVVNSGSSLNVYRITSVSGGTQLAANQMNRFATAMTDPVGQVFIGNPTVTLLNGGVILGSFAPPIGSSGANQGLVGAIGGAGFTLKPGEGLVYQQLVGNTGQRTNIEIVWTEP